LIAHPALAILLISGPSPAASVLSGWIWFDVRSEKDRKVHADGEWYRFQNVQPAALLIIMDGAEHTSAAPHQQTQGISRLLLLKRIQHVIQAGGEVSVNIGRTVSWLRGTATIEYRDAPKELRSISSEGCNQSIVIRVRWRSGVSAPRW
jgi:hypothetical protein